MISKEAEAIRTAILATRFTNEELNTIVEALRFSRSLLSQESVRTFRQGDNVKFTSNRDNSLYIGIVQTVGRKNIVVKTNRGLIRVPACMLTAA
jgi:hypothetical protein